MRKIAAVAVKEIRQAARDPLTLFLLLGMPAMMLLLYGYAVNFDVRHVRLAVQDLDRSSASRALLDSFQGSRYFDLVADLPAGADLHRFLERRSAKVVLLVPQGFSSDLARGRVASVQMIVDGTDANTATTVLGYAAGLVESWNQERARGATGGAARIAPVDYRPRVWFNPELQTTRFLVPGLIGFILMLTAVLSTALSVVREKERGTMEQLRVTSLHPLELVVGKTIPYLGISMVATVVILAAARGLFGIAVRGSHLDLAAATLIYLLGALGYGLLVSSLVTSQAMAFQVGLVTSMLPAIFLSGFIFPIRAMPVPLQWVSAIVPARYFITVLRGVILKGAELSTYGREMTFLAGFAAAMLALAGARLVRRET